MNFWHEYPYTDFHELNLSWILKKMRQIDVRMTDFEAVNKFKFYGDWEITKSYPIWSIVSGEDDNGYLAIQNVPAGITLDNEDYWVKVANYSALYADVQRRIIALEEDNEQIHNGQDQMQQDIADMQQDITDTNELLATTTTELTTKILKVLNSRKILIFGDSYTDDAFRSDSRTPFSTALASYLSNYPLIQFENHSLDGGRFSDNITTTYSNRVNAITTAFNVDEVTDILFIGGFNDRNYTSAEIMTGIENAIANARTRFPNARISIGHMGWSGRLASDDRLLLATKTIDVYRNASTKGAGYMTNFEYTLHDYELFMSDGVHPDSEGIAELAKQVALYIISGTCDVHYKYRSRTYSSGMDFTSSTYTVASALDNDIVTIWVPRETINFTSSTRSISHTDYTQWLQMTNNIDGTRQMFIGNFDDAKMVLPILNINGYFTKSDNTFIEASGITFVLSGGFLYAQSKSIGSAGSGFLNTDNIKSQQFAAGAVQIPTLYC